MGLFKCGYSFFGTGRGAADVVLGPGPVFLKYLLGSDWRLWLFLRLGGWVEWSEVEKRHCADFAQSGLQCGSTFGF